jgi:hypothetical protein
VIEVSMREQDRRDPELPQIHELEQIDDFLARIDQHTLARRLTSEQVAILVERRSSANVENHSSSSRELNIAGLYFEELTS